MQGNNTATTSDAALFSLNPNHEHIVTGALCTGFALLIMPLYIVILLVMSTDRELRSSPQYRLMNQFNFVDFGQAVYHIVSGVFIVFPTTQQRYQPLVRVVAATANSLWIAMFPIMSVLSISRILVITSTIPSRTMPTALKVANIVGWAFTIFLWLWGCFTQNITIAGIGLQYDFTTFGTSIVSLVEWYLCFPCLVITYVSYLTIFLYIEMKMRVMSHGDGCSPEIKLLLQSTFLFLYIASIMVMWHKAESWGLWSELTDQALNFGWVFLSYWNPLLLLSLNRTVREKVVRYICKALQPKVKTKAPMISGQSTRSATLFASRISDRIHSVC